MFECYKGDKHIEHSIVLAKGKETLDPWTVKVMGIKGTLRGW